MMSICSWVCVIHWNVFDLLGTALKEIVFLPEVFSFMLGFLIIELDLRKG